LLSSRLALPAGGFFRAKLAPTFGITQPMDHKELGQTGTRLPEVGLGTARYSGGTGPLRHAIELGAFLIDTAEGYGTEEMVGEAVKGIRQRVFLSTKVAWVNLGRSGLMKAAEGRLVRLRTDH
jgi:diketogulonate reductase-like aldo/keto reductase